MFCNKCGKELEDGSAFCIACGADTSSVQGAQSTTGYFDSYEAVKKEYNPQQVPPVSQKQPKPKKKRGLIASIIIAVLAVSIGQFAGKAVVNMQMGNEAEREIEEFIEFVEQYNGGICNENGYASEFWNLRFEANDSWVMHTDAERAALTAQMQSSGESSMREAAMGKNVSEELLDRLMNAYYAETEMAAAYEEYGYYVGELVMNVISLSDFVDMTDKELLQEMEGQLGGMVADIQYGDQMIAGEKYASMSMVIPSEGGNLEGKIFLKIKDGMLSTITIKYFEGFEYVLDSFLEQCSSY